MAQLPTIRVARVEDRKALKTFVRLPAPLYRDDPAWVAPLMFERLGLLAKDKNPYFEHAVAEYWIAYRDGRPVGRISAQVDALAQQLHGQGTGHFGFVEAPDDPAVFGALFAAAESWLRDRDMVRALGPFNLSINEECGLLVDGFEHPPRIMMGHARPYYGARLEGLGYRKAKDLRAYELEATREVPDSVQRILRRAEGRSPSAAATAPTPGCWLDWPSSTCWRSMTGCSHRCAMPSDATCSRSSKTAPNAPRP